LWAKHYSQRVADRSEIAHVTVEVRRCRGRHGAKPQISSVRQAVLDLASVARRTVSLSTAEETEDAEE
jgi:hypothetical protein